VEFREVIRKAVQIEESSYQLYSRVAKVAEDRSIKEFAQELAQWELSHREKLLSILEGKASVEELGKRVPQSLGIAELFDEEAQSVLGKDVKLEELLRFGIAREERTAKLYGALKSLADDEALSELLERLEKEEKLHREKLEKVYDEVVLEGP